MRITVNKNDNIPPHCNVIILVKLVSRRDGPDCARTFKCDENMASHVTTLEPSSSGRVAQEAIQLV